MNPTLLLAGCGMAVGLGAFLAWWAATPNHPRLVDIQDNLVPSALTGHPGVRRRREAPPAGATGRERAGVFVATHLRGVPALEVPAADLELLGESEAHYYGEKLLAAVLGFLFPLSLTLLSLVGLPLPPVVPFGLSLLLAAAFWFIPDLSVRTRAAQARVDYAYAAVSYLRLVAIQRLGSSALISSMEDSARISDEWMFTRIRQELALARYSKVPPWEALSDLSERVGVSELREIGDITRLAGESGAAVTGNLMARAASLRDKLISDEEVAAAKATTSMVAPLAMLFACFMVTLLYPAAVALLS